ncbi:MAG: Stp1/IreP family PP2C-type Ser/Thr phosphatase [Ruminococcaceae bacterium]|nr:Stp1/IreP family PP2C-type Ser/Thr phosphatase [Oscillospiraceae bacterium]
MFFYGITDVGKRRTANQDNFIVMRYASDVILAVVCDGMGGANGGNVASSVASTVFRDKMGDVEREHPMFYGMTGDDILASLSSAAKEANRAVHQLAMTDSSLQGMGTTLVGCLVSGEHAYVVNIGDSRLYLTRENEIKQISHDHSYVQYLVDMGKMSLEEAKNSKNKNLITRAVGTERAVESDLFTCDVQAGDMIVLCSDGLTNHVDPQEIGETVSGIKSGDDIQAACESLIASANDRGGLDNITAVILSI